MNIRAGSAGRTNQPGAGRDHDLDLDVNPGSDRAEVQVDPLEWPQFQHSVFPRGDRRGDRIGASLFLIWLVPSTTQALQHSRIPAVVVALALVYGGLYLAIWWVAMNASPARRVTLLSALFAVGIGYLAITFPTNTPSVLGYALSASVVLLPLAWARRLGLTCIVGAAVATRLVQGGVDWNATLVLTLITVITLGISRMARLVDKLRTAQAEIRALAVAGERARLARDLHDVLGHSLTTITVKTSLARRLLESGAPQDRALTEIRDTEELSRRALADIRATVSGQRRMSLAAELVSARAALTAARIDADLPRAVDDVAPQLAEPLAYVLREGITNVVRHSGARRCTVRLGPRWLEVRDDGPGQPGPANPGNGLSGLAERIGQLGGTISAGPVSGGGYRLRAEVPE